MGSPAEYLSGGDRIAIECAKRWASAGHSIVVITTRSGYAMYNRYLSSTQNTNFRIVSAPRALGGLATTILSTFACLLSSVIALRSSRISGEGTIIYAASDFWPDVLPALLLRRRLKDSFLIGTYYLPASSSLLKAYRGLVFLRGLAILIQQIPVYWLLRKFADMIWVTNEFDRARFIDGRLRNESVIAVKGGVDLSLVPPAEDQEEKAYDAVYIGRLHPQKGVLELLDSWAIVCRHRPTAQLAIIGVGLLQKLLRDKVEALHLESNVTFFGFLDGREKYEVIRKSMIVVHPAIYDSGGMAPAEAMAFGLPGVSFDLPSLRSYYPTGMLKTPCFDISQFARNIMDLLEDPELYQMVSIQALQLARSWNWDERAQHLYESVQRVLQARNHQTNLVSSHRTRRGRLEA